MVLLSFDIEEFDLPTEHGQAIGIEEQLSVSAQGLERILEVLEAENVVATFYSTATFLGGITPPLRSRLLAGGHEIASHGVHHSTFTEGDYAESRRILRELSGQEVYGFRMARMQPIDREAQRGAGYRYDSSLNPTIMPGRYNHFGASRLPSQDEQGFWLLPASVFPVIRFPLFWLSLHVLPLWLYVRMAGYTARHDYYLNLYFHPWEFADLRDLPYRLPGYILRHSGSSIQERLHTLIKYIKRRGESFTTTYDYCQAREATS